LSVTVLFINLGKQMVRMAHSVSYVPVLYSIFLFPEPKGKNTVKYHKRYFSTSANRSNTACWFQAFVETVSQDIT
jgi:hypothetical protein